MVLADRLRQSWGFWGRVLLVSAALVSVSGCEHAWRNGFLDPTQTGRFESKPIRNEIRRTLGPLDEPEGIPGAVEPTREDLVVTFAETPLERGDVIDVSVFELVQPGAPADVRRVVNELGFITLPTLGVVKVAGLTPRQLELDIGDKLKTAGILQEPEINISVVQSQGRRFSVIGNTNRVGEYPLPRPDFRVLEVVASIGPLSPFQQKLYIMRGGQPAGRTAPESEKLFINKPAGAAPAASQPVEKDPFAESDANGSVALSDFDTGRPTPSSPGSELLLDEDRASGGAALMATNGSAGSNVASTPKPAAARVGAAPTGGLSSADFTDLIDDRKSQPSEDLGGSASRAAPAGNWVFINNQWVEVNNAATQAATPGATAMPGVVQSTTSKPGGVDWEALSAAETPLRVIEIAVDALQKGDMRYNVVIRPNDIINVPAEGTGEYYMTGQIARPGAYALNGRAPTMKEAVAAAGGFALLAWPSRSEIIRRLPGDQEEVRMVNLDAILAGDQPDFFIRPNDIVNVGSTAVAPFLATIRNAFRMSYGFGFVYDRNFADQYSYTSRINPQTIDQTRRAQRQNQLGIPPGF